MAKGKALDPLGKHHRILSLGGSPSEVKGALLTWARESFPEVQAGLKRRRISLSEVKALISDLEEARPYSVRFDCGEGKGTWDPVVLFLGAFCRFGGMVRLRALVARVSGYRNPYRAAYSFLTGRGFTTINPPPEDGALLARAIVFPERALLMERLDLRWRNLRVLEGHLPPELAKPLAGAVLSEVIPSRLRTWDGVALYQDWDARLLVFDGKAHRVEDPDWPLVRRFLKRKRYTPLERARMALTAVRLKEWAE